MYKQLISVFILTTYFQFCICENCVFQTTCRCVFTNGSVIDLTSLGSHNGPRFANLKAVTVKDNFTYSYNPCYQFKLGSAGSCAKGVAVCQYDPIANEYQDCGDADTVNFLMETDQLRLVYSAAPRSTHVTLVCSEDATEPQLIVEGELQPELYEMKLISRCACPDKCESHLSTGSVLVILFMVFVIFYLFLGIIHSFLTRGATGWELIPHHEFWADFPLLVRDGCVFVVSGCKTETAYERI